MDLGKAAGEPDPRLISNRVRAAQRGPPHEYSAARFRLGRHCRLGGHLACRHLVRSIPARTAAIPSIQAGLIRYIAIVELNPHNEPHRHHAFVHDACTGNLPPQIRQPNIGAIARN